MADWEWGKHRGTPIEEIPDQYLEWACENMSLDKAVKAASAEIRRRGNEPPARKIRSEADKSLDQMQLEIRLVRGQIRELIEGLNRILVSAGLETCSLNAAPADREKRPDSESRSERAYPSAPQGNPLDDDTPF